MKSTCLWIVTAAILSFVIFFSIDRIFGIVASDVAPDHGKNQGHLFGAADAENQLEFEGRSLCRLDPDRPNASYPINQVDPPITQGYCKEKQDVCPSIFIPMDRIWDEMNRNFPTSMSKFAINIGANDGKADDPIYPLFEKYPDFGGVLVEPNPSFVEPLRTNYQSKPNVALVFGGVSPSTCAAIGKGNNQIKSGPNYPSDGMTVDVLKIDTDGCDCQLLESFMADSFYHRVKIIQIELNHGIVIPIVWKDMCKDDVHGRSSWYNQIIWGCSMQAAWDIVRPLGYVLLQYDWPDAVFVHRDYMHAFPCFFRYGESVQSIFTRHYWIGYWHARYKYTRWNASVWQAPDREYLETFTELATQAYTDPKAVLRGIVDKASKKFSHPKLQVEIGVTGTGIAGTVMWADNKTDNSMKNRAVKVVWKTCSNV